MFSKLFGRAKTPSFDGYEDLPYPDQPVEIVGDIHGCSDLMDALPPCIAGIPRIFVGDVVDRGPDSHGCLKRLQAHEAEGQGTCLLGNHEAMLLAFLDAPKQSGARWLRHGGLETLASFGIPLGGPTLEPAQILALRDAFREAMGPELETWLRNRPSLWRSGSLVVTHAGADPSRAITEQPQNALIWGHRNFFQKRRSDGLWVAHGHVIVDHPCAEDGRISLDTGAYLTGRLTMARIDPSGTVTFSIFALK
ncbi:MAG: metallophosphoesterase [Mangrovicoccus sp.]|nr:metallophosphoesterase [Mangrovicoccus sp.]